MNEGFLTQKKAMTDGPKRSDDGPGQAHPDHLESGQAAQGLAGSCMAGQASIQSGDAGSQGDAHAEPEGHVLVPAFPRGQPDRQQAKGEQSSGDEAQPPAVALLPNPTFRTQPLGGGWT